MVRRFFAGVGLAVLALGSSGCSFDFGGDSVGTNIAQGAACAFHYDSDTRIASDDGKLDARMDCHDTTDCTDSRNVMQHATIDLFIVIPPDTTSKDLLITSSDDSVLRLGALDDAIDPCEGEQYVHRTLTFDGVGDASLVVKAGKLELGRFGWSSFEPATVELEVQDETSSEWTSPASYDLQRYTFVRARVVNDADQRLISGGWTHFWVDDGEVAQLWGGLAISGRGQVLGIAGEGKTLLHLLAGNHESELEVRVSKTAAAALTDPTP